MSKFEKEIEDLLAKEVDLNKIWLIRWLTKERIFPSILPSIKEYFQDFEVVSQKNN